MACTIKLNYDCKEGTLLASASVINYNRKYDDTIWSIDLTMAITIVNMMLQFGALILQWQLQS